MKGITGIIIAAALAVTGGVCNWLYIQKQADSYRRIGEEELGCLQVVSSPLTRSSYHAGEVQRLMISHPR